MHSTQLARRLRLTPMAMRQHLYALQHEKLGDVGRTTGPIGRPAKHWLAAGRRAFSDVPN